MSQPKASYLDLLKTNQLPERVEQANKHLTNCNLCPLECHVNRLENQLGSCHTGKLAKVSSYGPHLGEETPLRGWNGSGTIFFTRCNLRCQFCQNYDISQSDQGFEVTPQRLANIMLTLQFEGCHNINLVSPSHVIPQIIEAIYLASLEGLTLPIVYNSGGYDSIIGLRLLNGIIDIYMPDMKYADETIARKLSKIPNYPNINQHAVREMHKQVGDLLLDKNNLAFKGLLIRHLVLPNNLAGSQKIFSFIANEISRNTYLNIMDQYRPAYHADRYPEINRPITLSEYSTTVEIAKKIGLSRLD